MALNTPQFFIFAVVVWIIYYSVNFRQRQRVLLMASLFFYAVLLNPSLMLALLAIIYISYYGARRLQSHSAATAKNRLLILNITAILCILILYKYIPFIFNSINSAGLFFLSRSLVPVPQTILTIGLSYYSFQAISYLADVYLEKTQPTTDWEVHALYLSFFPKLLQGPIERASHLVPQLSRSSKIDYDQFTRGGILILSGLFQKIVIADRLGLLVNRVYSNIEQSEPLIIFIAVALYSFQIYFDFSGYTDIALGTARCFQIELSPNFNLPYGAISIPDFWRRWHITFSKFLTDYLFTPLQMKYRNYRQGGTIIACLITFLVCGFWHGASWGFILWGLTHGLLFSASIISQPLRKKTLQISHLIQFPKLLKTIRIGWTFTIISLSWILFRANSVSDAFSIFKRLIRIPSRFALSQSGMEIFNYGLNRYDFIIAIFSIVAILFIQTLHQKKPVWDRLKMKPIWLRWSVYYMMIFSILLFGRFGESSFIYFQF